MKVGWGCDGGVGWVGDSKAGELICATEDLSTYQRRCRRRVGPAGDWGGSSGREERRETYSKFDFRRGKRDRFPGFFVGDFLGYASSGGFFGRLLHQRFYNCFTAVCVWIDDRDGFSIVAYHEFHF